MSVISTTIKINDAFSGALSKLASGLGKAQTGMKVLKGALSSGTNSFGGAEKKSDGLFKSMLGANIVGNAVSAGMGMAKNGISSMLGELNEASVSWQTFEGNMHQLGKSPAEIASAKADMQKFAQQTIYSASDMSTTYSQLAAVGTKNVGQLVKGFGGLAASAADPQQAMKTLSQQATQMAAKPTVQWQDFKLMLEQAPAGISAVAKSMGMSTQDMIKKIQDGKIKTQDFLNAVAKVGTNANFSKMATEYKTVGQAMDGLKETLANGLQPQFQKLSQIGIKAISSLSDKLGDLNWDSIGDGLVNAVNYVIPTFDKIKLAFDQFMDGFNDADVGDSLIDLFHSLVDALTDLMNTLDDSDDSGNSFFKILGSLSGSTISGLAKGLGALADVIGNLDPGTLRLLAVAFGILKMNTKGLVITGIVMALQLLSKLDADSLNKVAKGVTAIAIALALFKTYKKIKGTITGIADAFKKMKTPKTPKTPEVPETKTPDTGKPGKILSNAGAFMKLGAALFMVGGAIVLVGVGFKLLTDSAVKLASSGGAAIAVFFGMIAAIAVLAVLVKFLGPGMIAASVGFLMFAAALLIIGVAIFIASAGMALLATQLPIISQYGTSAALGILALAGAMAVFGLAAIIGAIGIVVLAVALVALAIGLAIAAVGALLLGVALIVVGVGALVAAVGMIMLGIGLALVAVFVMIAAVGMILLGVGLGLVAAFSIIGAIGLMLMAVALMLIAVSGIIAAVGLMLMAGALMLVAPVAMIAAVGILLLGVAVIVLGAGLLIVAAALMLVAAAMIMVGAAAMMMVAMFIMAGTMMVQAIVSAMQGVINAVKNGVNNAVNAVKNFASHMMSAGADLIKGLINGIKSMVGAAVNAAKNVGSKIVGSIKGFLHIGSPSRLMKKYGRWVDEGLIIGLNHSAGDVGDASLAMANGIVDSVASVSPTMDAISLTGSNPGDELVGGFNRALSAIGNVAGAISNLDGANANIGIFGQGQIAGSGVVGSNSVIGSGTLTPATTSFGQTTTTNQTQNQTHVNVDRGAIVIQSQGNESDDADKLLDLLEQKIMEQKDRAL